MKKLLCVLLAAMLFVTCFTGCRTSSDNDDSSSPAVGQQAKNEFVKPKNYASVVDVSINPQFKLYLDVDNTVLAVEFVNSDAKSIETEVSFKNLKVDEVVGNLVEAANDNGFVKKNAKINITVSEIRDENVDAEEVLDDISTSVDEKIEELDLEVKIRLSYVEYAEQTQTATPSVESVTASKNETSSEKMDEEVTSEVVSSDALSSENSSSSGAIYIEKPEYTYPSYSENYPDSMPTSPVGPTTSSDNNSSKVEKEYATNDDSLDTTDNDVDYSDSCATQPNN